MQHLGWRFLVATMLFAQLIWPWTQVHAQADFGFGTVWPTNVKDPESVVPTQEDANRRPLAFGYYLMELARLADQAEKNLDLERAAQFYRAISKAAPQRVTGPKKLCELYGKLKEGKKAREACQEALSREGAIRADFGKWLDALLALDQDDAAQATVLMEIQAVIENREGGADEKIALWQMVCESAARKGNQPWLDSCVPKLKELDPDNIRTITFAWNAAVSKGDENGAYNWIARAKKTGLDESSLQRMRNVTRQMIPQNTTQNGGSCNIGPKSNRSYFPFFMLIPILVPKVGGLQRLRSLRNRQPRRTRTCVLGIFSTFLWGLLFIRCTAYDVDIEIDLATTTLAETETEEGIDGMDSQTTTSAGNLSSTTSGISDSNAQGTDTTTGVNVEVEGEIWEALHGSVIVPRCAGAGCHDNGTKAGMLDLSEACSSYLSVLETQGPCQKPWVVPGRPEQSFLFEKLELATPSCGLRMPIGVELLPIEQQRIRDWIARGAPGCGAND